jgi:NTE family protein
MGQFISKKTNNNDYTFNDLIKDKGMELVITATDLNDRNTVYFNYKNYPDLPIRDAVRMSMSIPFLFTPVEFDGHLLVDGGVLDQCPEHVFDSKDVSDPASKLNLTEINPKTLAFDILEPDEHPDFAFEETQKIDNLKDFGSAVIGTLITGNERRYMRPTFWKRTVPIYVPKIPLRTFKLTKEQKEHLFDCGFHACEKFFE